MLHQLFANCYLFVQPSESEGLSIALLEAMSYSKAVMVSDIEENLEVVGNNGLVFINKNSIDLHEKITNLLEQPDMLKKSGQENLARVKEFYNWQNITDQTIGLYKKIIKLRQEDNLETLGKSVRIRA